VRALCAVLLLVLVSAAWPATDGLLPGGASHLVMSVAAASQLQSGAEAGPAAPPASQTQPPQTVPAGALSPFRVFAAIERAWNEGQPDSIVQFLPEDKILLRLEKSAPEKAFYSNKQAAYMLRDGFRFTMTESFEFLEFKYSKGKDEPPSARAEWSFRREPAGKVTVQKVRITLRVEAERWVVSEIKIQD